MSAQLYKPQDSIPIPPKNAHVLTTACDYCVVACSYKVYRWPVGTLGGKKANQNALNVDFPVAPLSGKWISPNQHNVVSHLGKPHHVVIIGNADARTVNINGDHSIRGGCIAQRCYNPDNLTSDRLQKPMIRIFGALTPVDWDTALDVCAEISNYVIKKHGEAAWAQKMYSYEFYENTYALTKFALRSINTPAFAPHDQPGPGLSTAGFRDAGYKNFGASYWDWGYSDVLLCSGTDPYETKTVLWNEWIMPGITQRGMRVIMVAPRKTTGAAFAEKHGGLFLQIIPGTDTVLHMALIRQILENGWEDREWIEYYVNNKWETDSGLGQGTQNTPWKWRTGWDELETKGFDDYKEWILAQEESKLENAEKITGIPKALIKKAAAMIAKPMSDGCRIRASIGIEKGNFWSNNYLNTASIAALATVIGTGGRPAQMIGRFGGHQRGEMAGGGYPRNKSPEKREGRRKKPIDLDRWLMSGHVRFAYVVGTTWTTAMAATKQLEEKFEQLTRKNEHQITSFNKKEIIETLKRRVDSGGMALVHQDMYLRKPIGSRFADIVLPAAGWGEEDFTRNNGERRLRFYSKFYDAPGQSKPDWWIVAQIAKRMGFPGFDWKNSNEVFEEAARFSRNRTSAYDNLLWIAKKKGMRGHDIVKRFGSSGIQTPVILTPIDHEDRQPMDFERKTVPKGRDELDKHIQEQKQLWKQYAGGDETITHDGLKAIGTIRTHDTKRKLPETGPAVRATWPKWLTHFNSQTGKVNLMKSPWSLWSDFYDWWAPDSARGEFWVVNGRVNEVWQSGFDDLERRPYIQERWPDNWIEINPEDAEKLGIESGDYVEVSNNRIPVQTDYNQAVFKDDFRFTQLVKQGHIELHEAKVNAVAVVTPHILKGVTWMYFLHPKQHANSLVPMIPDPITNCYRFKLGVGKIKKTGESPYKHDFTRMSFKRRDII
ncbi:Assimilatory nitrate reductase large subunit [hydrothermal vent metagenome]|uniref:Assimilatory nitrate reductase large subunit n=1 Tax=hydrothermal vent metagenome TaxID=652676 RepID=A0A3B1CV45_9ZZZZ